MSPIVCKILSQTLLKRNLIDVEFVANFLDQNKLEEENLMEKSTRAKKILSISHINVNPYRTKKQTFKMFYNSSAKEVCAISNSIIFPRLNEVLILLKLCDQTKFSNNRNKERNIITKLPLGLSTYVCTGKL